MFFSYWTAPTPFLVYDSMQICSYDTKSNSVSTDTSIVKCGKAIRAHSYFGYISDSFTLGRSESESKSFFDLCRSSR